jgi:predicted Zn-dependent protease
VKAPSGLPLEAEEARQAVRPLLSLPGADGIEAVITGSRTGLTRYARSEIIQNTVKEELRAYVRVVVGDRVASSATNQLDPDSLRSAAAKALEAARASRPDAEFPGLADPEVVGGTSPLFRWDDAVASASASERARAVSEVLKITSGAKAAGIFETSAHAFGIFSSTGMDRFDAYTRCMVTCLTDRGKGATGWGEGTSHRREEVDVEAAARRARGGGGWGGGPPAAARGGAGAGGAAAAPPPPRGGAPPPPRGHFGGSSPGGTGGGVGAIAAMVAPLARGSRRASASW